MLEWMIFLLVGAIAGFLAGLLGIGGGFVIVPAALWLFPYFGVEDAVIMHMAVATSLATICITSISSLRAHHKKGGIDWPYVRLLAPGIVLGSLLAGWLAQWLSSMVLSLVFAIGAILMALRLWFAGAPKARNQPPAKWAVTVSATAIGSASALVGIGGGSLIVPYLHYLGEKISRCIGTAAACGLPIALAGSLGFLLSGWQAATPEYSLGFVFLPAFFGIIATSIFTAPLGARLAHALPAARLKQIFAFFLLLVGMRILFKILG